MGHDKDEIVLANGFTNPPVHRSAGHFLGSSSRAARLYAWEELYGDVYSRISNPTARALEDAITTIEGGKSSVATASGQSAVHIALEPLLYPGDNFIASTKLYGGTESIFSKFVKYGIEQRRADPTNPASVLALIDDKTRAIFVESIANPDGTVPDFEGIADIAHNKRIPFIVDNTLASPYLFRPIEHGAHIVVHSTTKYINGHGNAVGGVVVDGGIFPWDNDPRYPALTQPASGREISLWEQHKDCAYAVLVRQTLAAFGPCASPDNASLTLAGLKTLPLRMERHLNNAKLVAEFLTSRAEVTDVRYAGLKSNPNHERAQRYLSGHGGAVVLVTFAGGEKAAHTVLHNLRAFEHKANIGETRSLVIHPASTTHNQCTKEQLDDAGIRPGTLRLALGIEPSEKLIGDLKQALDSLPKPDLA